MISDGVWESDDTTLEVQDTRWRILVYWNFRK